MLGKWNWNIKWSNKYQKLKKLRKKGKKIVNYQFQFEIKLPLIIVDFKNTSHSTLIEMGDGQGMIYSEIILVLNNSYINFILYLRRIYVIDFSRNIFRYSINR